MSDKYNKEEPSVIQKIQNQTGCLLLVIGIAMLAFVLTDLLSSGNSILGGSQASIGTIDGEDVDIQEYQQMVDVSLANFQAQNPGMSLSTEMRASLEQQAWNTIVQQKLVTREHSKLGLTVSPAELEDITIGDNPHPRVIRSFTNPETQQFDKAQLIQFLDNLDLDPEQKSQWVGFEKSLIDDVRAQKYATLVKNMFYGTELEARQRIIRDELSINASIVGITYSSIPDSTVEISDKDIRQYLRDNASEYEQDAQREIEYVSFDVIPSSEDSAETRNFIESSREAFQKAEDDSLFVELKGTETPFDPTFKVRGNFTPDVEDALFDADSGDVLGPYESKGTYALFKISGVGEDSLKSVRASHILFRIMPGTDQDTAKALADANAMLRDIRAGRKDFAEEAKVNTDGSSSKGGDLGWLREDSRKVPEEFVKKAMSTAQGGYFIVTTRNGVHLGKVTSPVSRKTIKVARLTQTVTPSSETDRTAYRKAGQFMSKSKGDVSFEEVADEMGMSVRIAKGITEQERRVSGINNGNIVARWLFDPSTEEGSISDIIEVDEKYVVARCVRILEEGLPEVEDVRAEVEPLVIAQLKGEMLKDKVQEAYDNASSAEDLASALETQVTPIPVISFSSGSLPYVGFDNIMIGTVFGVPVGQNSGVVVGETGVYVVYVNNENQYEMPSDIGVKQMEITDMYNQGVDAEVEQSLLKLGDVQDQRYKYFD